MTAVQWLIEELKKVHHPTEAMIMYAKKLEKQQIIDAYNKSFELRDKPYSTADKYYTSTYGSKGSDTNSEKPNVLSSKTEISDGEIQSTAETFWTEPSESDMKRGWKLGAKWYREQLKQRQ